MIDLTPHNLHWIGDTNSEYDLCVHGGFTFSFNKKIIIDASKEEFALSAAVIFLLRTVERDHSFGNKLCEKIMPECADITFVKEFDKQVEFITCPFGIDWWVEHSNGNITLVFEDGTEIKTTLKDYIQAIIRFADNIKAFYDKSKAKSFQMDEDRQAFNAFQDEWTDRIKNAIKLL
jgi:hypothetical protein